MRTDTSERPGRRANAFALGLGRAVRISKPRVAGRTFLPQRFDLIVLGPLLWLLSFGPANESDPPCPGGTGRGAASREDLFISNQCSVPRYAARTAGDA